MNASAFDQNLSHWDVSLVTEMGDMFSGVTLSTENYDALLNGWNAQTIQNGVTFDGGNSNYCLAEPAHDNLTSPTGHNWTITDGGKDCPVVPGTPDPRFPKNNYEVTSGTSLFKWTVADNATGYEMELYDSGRCAFRHTDLSEASVIQSSASSTCLISLNANMEVGIGVYVAPMEVIAGRLEQHRHLRLCTGRPLERHWSSGECCHRY